MGLGKLRNLQVMYGNCHFERLCLQLVHLGHDAPPSCVPLIIPILHYLFSPSCVPADDIHPTSPVFPILCSG